MPDPPLPKGYSIQEEPPLPKGYTAGPAASAAPATPEQPNSVIGGAGRRIVDTVKGVGGAISNPKSLVTGVVDSEKEAWNQSKKYYKDAQSVKGDPIVKALTYLHSGTTAASMLLPMLATGSVTNINNLTDQGRNKEALGAGLVDAGLLGAGTKAGAKVIGKTAGKIIGGDRSLAKADGAVANYVGLQKSDLPKWERTKPGSVEDIGKTVREEVGVKSDITKQHQAIEDRREQINQDTHTLVSKTKNVTATPIAPIISNITTNLEKELQSAGVPPEQLRAVKVNALELLDKYKQPYMNPSDLLDMRKNIQGQIKWSADPSVINVKNQFYQTLYHDLNDAIGKSLNDPEAAAEFKRLNKTQSRLIIAREAAGKKIVNTALKATPGLATALARIAGGAAAGGAGGAAFGHAGVGAALGAAAPALDALRGVNFPVADIRAATARGAVGNALPGMSPAIQAGAGAGVAGQSSIPMPQK